MNNWDKVEFAIPPREILWRELRQGVRDKLVESQGVQAPKLIKYADFIEAEEGFYLVRSTEVEDTVAFESRDLKETCEALLLVLQVIQAFHQQKVVCGGVSQGLLRRTVTGELYLQDPRVWNYLSPQLADDRYNFDPVPEVIRGNEWGLAADLFSWGVLAYQLLTNKVPFSGANSSDRSAALLRGKTIAPRDLNPQLSTIANKLIMETLKVNPSARPNLSQLLAAWKDLVETGEYSVSSEEADSYREFALKQQKKQQLQERRWLWWRKYGRLCQVVTVTTVVLVAFFVFLKPTPTITEAATPIDVVNYYFESVQTTNVSLMQETLHRVDNSLEDIISNIHVINAQLSINMFDKAEGIKISVEDLKITSLEETANEVRYRIGYTFKVDMPQGMETLEREDEFTLQPVSKVWRITEIKVLSELGSPAFLK